MFSLFAKLQVCPLFEISTIDLPLFRGWGPPVRGGIVIWLTRALRARQHVIGLVCMVNAYRAHHKYYGSHFVVFVVALYQLIFSISFRVASLALGQSYDYPSASEATLIHTGKQISKLQQDNHEITTKQSTIQQHLYSMGYTVCWTTIPVKTHVPCLTFPGYPMHPELLTHWGQVMPLWLSKLNHYWFK